MASIFLSEISFATETVRREENAERILRRDVEVWNNYFRE